MIFFLERIKMEITTRKTAAERGKSKYFTGKPCKNGHIAERYTQSGTCEACLRGHVAAERENMTYADSRKMVSNAKAELGVFGVRVNPEGLETVRGVALALAQARFPGLTMTDVIANPNPANITGNTGFYKFRVHGADIDFLRGVAQSLLNARKPDFSQVHAKQRELMGDAAYSGRIPDGPLT